MTLFTRMSGYNRILALGSSAGGLGEGGGGVKVSRGPIWEVPLRSSLNFSHYEEGCTYSAVVTATVLLTRIPDFWSGRTRCIKSAFSAWVAISKKPPRLPCSVVAPASLCPGNMLRGIYLPTCGGGATHATPRQKWQIPSFLVSHLVHKGVNWPSAHFSSGMRWAAKQ